jgi:hypothetical protein
MTERYATFEQVQMQHMAYKAEGGLCAVLPNRFG